MRARIFASSISLPGMTVISIGHGELRLFQHHIGDVGTSLGTQPFLIEAPAAIFVEIHEVGDVADLAIARQPGERIILRIFSA